jgi:hypothetical protein
MAKETLRTTLIEIRIIFTSLRVFVEKRFMTALVAC